MRRLIPSLLLAAAIAGCHRSAPRFESLPTYPVEGRVLVQGKPAEGVQVFLHPRAAAQRGKPRGTTDAEGNFRLRTYHDGDGAPAGEYAVTIYWPGPYNPKMAVEDQMPADRLGGRFMDPARSPLQATVSAGPTTLPPLEIN
jgi:hypothetical protein